MPQTQPLVNKFIKGVNTDIAEDLLPADFLAGGHNIKLTNNDNKQGIVQKQEGYIRKLLGYPDNLKPLAVQEFNDVAYIVSYDLDTDDGTIEIGTYPSADLSTLGSGDTCNKVYEYAPLPNFKNISAPTVIITNVTNITDDAAKIHCNVTSDGGLPVTDRGICYAISHNPTLDDTIKQSGSGTGTYNITISGLNSNTSYYVRAYAISDAGLSYSDETEVRTIALPTMQLNVSDITETTLKANCDAVSDGGSSISSRGVCWGTSANPNTSGSHTVSGSGLGTYSITVTGLTGGTTYHLRSYGINAAGTAYSPDVTATTTAPSTPVVPTATLSVPSKRFDEIDTDCNITSNGGATIIERGVCWSKASTPTINDPKAVYTPAGTGAYSIKIGNIDPNTLYYIRAYATNSAGTGYSDEVQEATNIAPSGTLSLSTVNVEAGGVFHFTVNYVGGPDGYGWRLKWGHGGNNTIISFTPDSGLGDTAVPPGGTGVIAEADAAAMPGDVITYDLLSTDSSGGAEGQALESIQITIINA